MSGNPRAKTAYGMRPDGFRNEVAVAERIEHGRMRGQVAAPAHTHGGEYGNDVIVYKAFGNESGHQAQRGAHRT